MLNLGLTGTIHLAIEPVDGRKGIDGLAGVVRATLGHDPTSGDLFVFRNRRGGSLKILAWMGDSFALYLRRLEMGTFAFPTTSSPELTITPTQLAMILGGVEPATTRTRRRFQKGSQSSRTSTGSGAYC
jgi:transposase